MFEKLFGKLYEEYTFGKKLQDINMPFTGLLKANKIAINFLGEKGVEILPRTPKMILLYTRNSIANLEAKLLEKENIDVKEEPIIEPWSMVQLMEKYYDEILEALSKLEEKINEIEDIKKIEEFLDEADEKMFEYEAFGGDHE